MLRFIRSNFFENFIELNYTLVYGSDRTCSVEDVEESPENLEIIDTGSTHRSVSVNQTKINPTQGKLFHFIAMA